MFRLFLITFLTVSCSATDFKDEIAPLLVQHCLKCHEPENIKGGYRVDTIEQLFKPGKSKDSPIVPGKPEESKLYQLLVTSDDDDRMPQKAPALTREITA